MSSATIPQTGPAAAPQPDNGPGRTPAIRPHRGFFTRIALHVLGVWGARLGLAWIGFLVLLAVFAPLLANSHPILWKHRGEISSPLLRHLTPVDVTLFVALLAAVAIAPLRFLRPATRVWAWVGVVAVAAALAWSFVDPPQALVLSKYREAIEAGEVEWSYTTPIPYSPNDRLRDILSREGVDPRLLPPSAEHWMGTTENGADLASRMIHAARIALAIGLIATGIAVAIGVVVGGVMGYFSGWVDLIGMRLVEIFAAIPVIFLLIMIVAFYGRSLYLMMVILGLTGWVGYALYVRAEFLKLRSMDYVQAARALGTPLWSILFRHMLPNGVTPVLVLASFGIASAILTESTLSFLGLGLVEEPSWGQMLNQARTAGNQWGLVIFPGLAIFLTVFAYNLVGEAFRDALDPRTQQREG